MVTDKGSDDRTDDRTDDRPGDGRDETKEERLDRKWADLLQELRVMQTGVQLTAGFLLTLPFQSAFAELDDLQRTVYLSLVVIAGLTTAMVLAPVAAHRLLSGRHVKERVVAIAHHLVGVVLGSIGLLITGTVFFIFSIVTDRTTAVVVTAWVAVAVILLLAVLPWRLLDKD
jgi:SNF family Na+-dependent transporter